MDKERSILFHLDVDVLPAEDMKTCVAEFFDMVKSASEDCLNNITWMAEIQHGSVALAAYPVSDTESDEEIDQCLSDIRNEFKVIRGGKQSNVFSHKTLAHYSKLVALIPEGDREEHCPTININSPGVAVEPPVEMVAYKMPTSTPAYRKAFGTTFGEVKTLFSSDTKRPYLALYDEASKKRIKVYYDDELLGTVRNCYRNNVRITGEITYNPDGSKNRIDASEIEIAQPRKAAKLSELFGILGDAK